MNRYNEIGFFRSRASACLPAIRKILVSAAAAVLSSVSAADRSLIWRDGVGTSVTNAVNWSDPANWLNGEVAGTGDSAFLTNKTTGLLFVRSEKELELAQLFAKVSGEDMTTTSAYQVHFISDYPLKINGTKTPGIASIRLYADVILSESLSKYNDSVLMCGDVNNGAIVLGNMTFTHHMDLYANSAGEERLNPGTTNSYRSASRQAIWYAPQGSSVDVVGQWSQTEGSRYLFRTGEPHALCVGTLVHGTGIPEGAFLKRVFDDGTIEISEPATATVTENDVTFDAFSPKVLQFLSGYDADTGGSGGAIGTSRAQKYRDEDEFTMEIGKIVLSEKFGHRFTTDAGYRPARWLLHDTSGVLGKIYLGDCHIEFAAKLDGTATAVGFPNTYVIQESSGYRSRLVVGAGLSGSIGYVYNFIGTIVKSGEGTLATSLAYETSRNTGTLVVEEGVLELTGDAQHRVKTLAISNGAVLKVSGGTLQVDELVVEPGARIEGGTVELSSFAACTAAWSAGAVCANGGALSCTGSADAVLWEPAATNVAGNPALWFDLSYGESISTATDGDGKERITRLDDVRGEGHMFATNSSSELLGPRLIRDADGKPRLYYAEYKRYEGTDSPDQHYALIWNSRLAGIRSVFKVISKPGGVTGGQFLGCTWDALSGWMRPALQDWNAPLFHSYWVHDDPAISNGEFRINGFLRDWHDGLAYRGGHIDYREEYRFVPQVLEFHLADGPSPEADNCGDYTHVSSDTPRAGGNMLYEILVYTNDLTAAEKLQIRGYLMKKWLNAEAEYAAEEGSTVNAGDVDVGENGWNFGLSAGNLLIKSLTGSGPLEKSGAGTLYLEDHVRPSATLEVAEGKMVLRSEVPDVGDIPEGAYLHVDASEEATYETDESGNVTEWRDRRGGDYPTMMKIGAAGKPKPKQSAWNGLTMIDMPTSEYSTDRYSSGFKFEACDDARSVFSVLISRTNTAPDYVRYDGGVLLGFHGRKEPLERDSVNGIFRYSGGRRTGQIVGGDGWVYYQTTASMLNDYGPGASRGRLNGEYKDFSDTYYNCEGRADMASFVTYEPIWTDALGHSWNTGSSTTPYCFWGAQILGETIVYETALAPSSVNKVEAYLNRKWFGIDTIGYRAASAGSLEVASGAELEIVGNSPVTVSSLSGGGTVDGAVMFASDSELIVPIVDGSIEPLTLTGALTGTAVVRLTGDPKTLPVGTYTLLSAQSVTAEGWSLVFDSPDARRCYVLRRTATGLMLTVIPRGFMIRVR